jgi:hypothetical protein
MSSTGHPTDFAVASIPRRSGWAKGSPNPPKKRVGRGETLRTPSMIRAKVAEDIIPGGSSHTFRMQVRQRRLQRVVGST